MNRTFSELIDDIEKLVGKELRSIQSGAEIRVDDVDRDSKNVAVSSCGDGSKNTRSFSEIQKIWNAATKAALTDEPWIHVDSVLGGAGTKRNQPETLLINLPYFVYCYHKGKKHIAYVCREVHEYGDTCKMEEGDIISVLVGFRNAERKDNLYGQARNLVFFGAPGTGKSYQLNKLAKTSFGKNNIRRVTFYPDYTYSQFVGCFKPYSEPGNKEISYEFVKGPFLETYLKAITHPYDNYALLIEELNRANPAAVFGDVFQLLDRDKDGNSVYPVATSREMADCIGEYLDNLEDKDTVKAAIESYYDPDLDFDAFCEMICKDLCLPSNMYIWATMNSADQGVFPMDTAFKRRWSFEYMGINAGATAKIDGIALNEIKVPCGKHKVKWNDLRVAINDFLMSDEIHVNEDKLLGPFFIAPASLTSESFTQIFKAKVLMYLYEDAGKTKRTKLFRTDLKTYSQVCDAFEEEGTTIFGDGFVAPEFCSSEEIDVADDVNDFQE